MSGKPAQSAASATSHGTPLVQVTGLPVLGHHAFQGLAGDIVETVSPCTEAHPAALLGALIVGFGCAVGRGPHFTASGTRHFCNENFVIVGRSSRARKSTAVGNTRSILETVGILPPTASGLSSGEGLIEAIRDGRPNARRDEDDDDVDLGVEDKRLLITEEEFARTLVAMHRPGNTLSTILRLGFDGQPWRSLTLNNKGLTCAEPHPCLIGCITAEELCKRLGEIDAMNGFGNRVLWALVDRPHLLPLAGDLPWAKLKPLLRRLKKAFGFARVAGELHRTPEADELWVELYAKFAATNYGGIVGCLTDRAEAHVLRLAMLFALLDLKPDEAPEISVDHLNAAVAFWNYCDASVRSIFGALSKHAKDVKAVLDEGKPSELSRDHIKAALGNHLWGDKLTVALDELRREGLADFRRVETGGRPCELWRAV